VEDFDVEDGVQYAENGYEDIAQPKPQHRHAKILHKLFTFLFAWFGWMDKVEFAIIWAGVGGMC
jgi:hypothetical protein